VIILSLRTDKPDSEIGLFDDEKKLAYEVWQAHRQLAESLHKKIEAMLASQSKTLADIEGIVMYEGPGSFTGLRIGISVGNALAYSYNLPAVGLAGENWVEVGIKKLLSGEAKREPIIPVYGSEAHTT